MVLAAMPTIIAITRTGALIIRIIGTGRAAENTVDSRTTGDLAGTGKTPGIVTMVDRNTGLIQTAMTGTVLTGRIIVCTLRQLPEALSIEYSVPVWVMHLLKLQ